MTEIDGVAGRSATREYERRRARDEQRVRDEWGPFGWIAAALMSERQSTRAWSSGAVGEARVGAALDRIRSESIRVLHDRRIPGTRANIDHLVVSPHAVWVVDSKRYTGRPALRVEGGIIRPRTEKLVVRGRDRTKMVDGVLGQVERVRAVLDGVPIVGSLCFVDADWPLFGGAFRIRGVEVLWPARLTERIRADRGAVDVDAVTAALAAHFRPA